ncbi:hypothetical protein [uncultured Gemmiger sp.]|uniref:hypothetical protein n=1 Tax=uncultured Gemmiger sp. TaxID=1623490 RepID=UPI0025D0FE9A|nr:hypothetical protein [uncultured Gemmiger sp.]
MGLFTRGDNSRPAEPPQQAADPLPDVDRAMEDIQRSRRAYPAFLHWYEEEILQFWEGHCCEPHD